MISKLRIFESGGFDPYTNLAIEQRLLETVGRDECILYLWQNQNTVVIGRNQNPWAECRVSVLEAEGGKLARRLSGGGAVFHDLGNLNFTFLMATENYDLSRQLQVIQKACSYAGIEAVASGRNDLLADGRKFSGNAFYHSKGKSYHHGTILIDVDGSKLQRYLSPPKAKLEAKGVSSVRSRVVNLIQLQPNLTCPQMKQYMAAAFGAVYGGKPEPVCLSAEDQAVIEGYRRENTNWQLLFGKPLPFSFGCESHFPWGHVQLQLQAASGIITAVTVYSDAMDWSLSEQLQQALTGCPFHLGAMQDAIRASLSDPVISKDLCDLLKQQEI